MGGRVGLILGVLLAAAPAAARAQDSVAATLRPFIASATLPLARWPDFSPHAEAVARLYASRADALLWIDRGRPTPAAHEAMTALGSAGAHGLDPGDYDAATLGRLAATLRSGRPAADLAGFDLLLTVDLLRLVDDLRSGRLADEPYARPRRTGSRVDLAAVLSEALRADTVARLVAASAPPLTQYHNLQRLLALYSRLAADTTLGPVETAGPVRPGDRFSQVTMLRRRLRALRDLPEHAADTAAVYGAADAAGVRRFQRRHGLASDGILGEATLSALNTPLSLRVRQIELAMERLRWLPPLEGRRFLVVNIPAFALFAFDSTGGSGSPSRWMKVVVGKAVNTRTPMLYAEMRAVEFRPSWNVPRSILVKELLPVLRRQPRYLRAHDMELVGADGRPLGDQVTAEVMRRLSRGELRVRQRPGPHNALGLVKFDFPNPEAVYLHGTPDSLLFSRPRRDFSHGCIRVEDPIGLAQWVLHDRPEWTRAEIERAVAGRSSHRVVLARP
ncbi:MAG TPA: L,D-transpeptidase family protein, partial [Gemmatimonadales bacterium]|nr:L,D-transpeptidase family protein [Gemmatimonadales bacterium]